MRRVLGAALASALGASPALAVSPVLTCHEVVEAGMALSDVRLLDPELGDAGLTVETYRNAAADRAAPVPELSGFSGTRLSFCPTGEFLVVPGLRAGDVADAVSAEGSLRARVRAGDDIGFADLREAVEAVYGPVLVLRETDQTCACHTFFDEQRPPGQTPFPERTDVDH